MLSLWFAYSRFASNELILDGFLTFFCLNLVQYMVLKRSILYLLFVGFILIFVGPISLATKASDGSCL
ncbi:hypothetical protein Hanom_Chr03g00197381 [Helianthus anomalus]